MPDRQLTRPVSAASEPVSPRRVVAWERGGRALDEHGPLPLREPRSRPYGIELVLK